MGYRYEDHIPTGYVTRHHDHPGTDQYHQAKAHAYHGSRDLLTKLLTYGVNNNGLPNMTREMCRERLISMRGRL